MRLRSMVAAGVAVLALTAVSGCGDDGGGDEGGAADGWGYGQSAGSGGGGRLMDTETEGRPSAATTAEIETFVSGRTTCTDLHMQARDYDDEDNPEAEAAGELWGISERAICYDETRNGVTLMSVNDMKSFRPRRRSGPPTGTTSSVRTSPSRVVPRHGPISGSPGCSPSSATRRSRSPVVIRRRRRSWTVAP